MSDLPIGYWLKHLDRLIENDFDRTLASESLGRRHWQVLHSLYEEPGTLADLDRRLAAFLDDSEVSTAPAVEDLRRRGWLEGLVALDLTDAGRRAHDDLFGKVRASRERISRGISSEEYRAAVSVLERMSANLEAGPDAD
ncbi:MarR family winged helix-turn-helix transcriptional regulator [Nocardiopsis changdeensis]|uniref:Winged helix-turn-helix transcriptional regulator n=1 Tax=Nocardiopsis changdeensis TaxID=2831969 RepID=A0ABX8BTW8_9ACTN|nr:MULTISPECIES: winged helix DNA-binding protein [Nocardiopsis]QUX25546.1 winged helix-turn-helix transcriptional regulator [Nocardiopsis changdeensis]QYX35932.1 MarR family winged helix-turn-helix transcriptional regulator [Nocardiopsis sp. MT53]